MEGRLTDFNNLKTHLRYMYKFEETALHFDNKEKFTAKRKALDIIMKTRMLIISSTKHVLPG